ncbi:MAG: FAD-dependent oxidoreductase, partial [Sporosarcina sp.]
MSEQLLDVQKNEVISKSQEDKFDLLIIGGGITGAGIALDAASRGMKTALVEMQDFAAGTSSRSTKMIHGGLRYLKNFEVKLVAQVGKERAVVYENGPHVTTPEWLLLPIYKDGTMGKFTTSVGLRAYDFLAGVKKEERKSMLTKERTLHAEPKLKQEGLVGAGRFVEYRSDDARLTIEVMKEAVRQGATVFNYTKVTNFIYNNGKVAGVCVVDELNGQASEIRAQTVVNAAGPWVDTLREIDNSLDTKE